MSPTITDLSQLKSVWDEEQKLDWLMDGLIAKGSVTMISAESGTGKSWLAYYLAGQVAHGREALGRKTEQCKVLYVDGENPVFVAKRNLDELGIPKTADLLVWGGWIIDPPPGPDHKLVEDFAQQHGGLIIYDSLVEFHEGDEISATETRAFMQRFRKLANYGATVIVLHHTGKATTSKQYRGSSDFKGAVDTAYLLTTETQHEGALGTLCLECFKARLAPGAKLRLEFRKGKGFVATDVSAGKPDPIAIVKQIVAENPGLNQTQIVQQAKEKGVSKHKVEDALKTSAFGSESGTGNEKHYFVAEPDSDEEIPVVEAEPATE